MPLYEYVDDKRTFQRGVFSLFAVVLAGLCFANPAGIFRSEKKEEESTNRRWPRRRQSQSDSESSSSSSSNNSSQSSLDEPIPSRTVNRHTFSRDGMRARYPSSYHHPPDSVSSHTHHHRSHHQRHNSSQQIRSRSEDPFAWENTLKGL
jgi:hypothetical protein